MASRVELPERLMVPLPSGEVAVADGEIMRLLPEAMGRIAGQLVDISLDVKEGDRLLIHYHPGGRWLVAAIGHLAAAKGAAVVHRCEDPVVTMAILAGMEKKPMPSALEEIWLAKHSYMAWAEKVMLVLCDDTPEAKEMIGREVEQENSRVSWPSRSVRLQRRRWCVCFVPSTADARTEGMNYSEYVKMWLAAGDRDWREVDRVQQILIDKLNQGKELELYADPLSSDRRWTTYLRMSIAGMRFANSTMDVNFPGSEVFAAPVRGTIEGRLAIPYKVRLGRRELPNLVLDFEGGRVVDFYTDGDRKWVEGVLDTDEGAREVGEVALGTNPALNRPLLNELLVEKVGGSFHIALGNAYKHRRYARRWVRVDNGVVSAIHQDLTRLMLPEYGGGRVVVDGEVIQENGRFIDERLAILNPVG